MWYVDSFELWQWRRYIEISERSVLVADENQIIRTSKCKFRARISPSLIVTYKSQNLAKARFREKSTVFRVRDLPYLSEYGRRQPRFLEELDGIFAGNDSDLSAVCLFEELPKDTFLVGSQVQDRVI